MSQPADIEIARAARLRPIAEIGAALGVTSDSLLPIGHDKAKLSAAFLASLEGRKPGHLVLVTAINPTPAGEGKTTTTVGLGDALAQLGHRTAICLREPSLGPCFGMKGGATGGGHAQVAPMEDINLHFTGDFHAITSAHNLLAALIDNHIHWGNKLGIDPRRVLWRRVLDMNDRSLRHVVTGLGGPAHGTPAERGFDITVASEVMAVLCLARDRADLERRLGDIVVAQTHERQPVTARDVKADGAMAVLLAQAALPNLVQSLEGTPAFVHGGPFANIAHGCNSVMATRAGLALADYVVTEAGFGADLGAEKFFDIKCRQAGLKPAAAVVVASIRALKYNGGVARADLGVENLDALREGCANLLRHIENVGQFGVPCVVGINRFVTDTEAELAMVKEVVAGAGAEAHVCTHWADGGKGALSLAEAIVARVESGKAAFAPLYPDSMPLFDKIETVAKRIYRAGSVEMAPKLRKQLADWEAAGYGNLPVCMAKTPYSFTEDPNLRGVPEGFALPVTDLRLSAGAGFVVALCGDVMTMPGLPRVPAAEAIRFGEDGEVEGLF